MHHALQDKRTTGLDAALLTPELRLAGLNFPPLNNTWVKIRFHRVRVGYIAPDIRNVGLGLGLGIVSLRCTWPWSGELRRNHLRVADRVVPTGHDDSERHGTRGIL